MGGNEILISTVKLKGHPHSNPPNWAIRREGRAFWREGNEPSATEERSRLCLDAHGFSRSMDRVRFIISQFLGDPSCILSLRVNFRGSTERARGRVMGKERSAIYLGSRAPILVFSGFLCHLRQTKVKCFCLVNIAVTWTAAFPTGVLVLSCGCHSLKSNCISICWFSGESQLQHGGGPSQTHDERQAAPCKPRSGPDVPHVYRLLWL